MFSVILFHSESPKLPSRVWVSEHGFPKENKLLLFTEHRGPVYTLSNSG